jgi:hypothetical protein
MLFTIKNSDVNPQFAFVVGTRSETSRVKQCQCPCDRSEPFCCKCGSSTALATKITNFEISGTMSQTLGCTKRTIVSDGLTFVVGDTHTILDSNMWIKFTAKHDVEKNALFAAVQEISSWDLCIAQPRKSNNYHIYEDSLWYKDIKIIGHGVSNYQLSMDSNGFKNVDIPDGISLDKLLITIQNRLLKVNELRLHDSSKY